MAQLENLTPFAAVHLSAVSFDDHQLAVVVVAGSFDMPPAGQPGREPLAPSEQQPPVPVADEYWGEPGASSLRCEGQSAHLRPGTDVYLNGHAWAPGGAPLERSVVGLEVGPLRRGAVVFGDRYWSQGVTLRASRPAPFTSVPLTYERCFGGSPPDPPRAVALASALNPVGRGLFARERDAVGGLLPNVEDAQALIQSPRDRPAPIGFGPIARHWQPRRQYGGTYDDAWVQTRAPLWPRDVDPRLLCAAAPGLTARPHLQGGEPVRLTGMHPDGGLSFSLPRVALHAKFYLRGGRARRHVRTMPMDGVQLEPDQGRVTLFWRTSLVVDPDPMALERIVLRERQPWEDPPR